MPTDTTNTTQAAQAVAGGILPDSEKFTALLARLTASERAQVMQLVTSLLADIA
jgi:hypothetical protein